MIGFIIEDNSIRKMSIPDHLDQSKLYATEDEAKDVLLQRIRDKINYHYHEITQLKELRRKVKGIDKA